MKHWTHEHVDQLTDYLTLNGDLVLKSGQEAIVVAIKSVPEDLTEMDAWCDKWLDEKARFKLVSSIIELN
jgi:hypothetical protein